MKLQRLIIALVFVPLCLGISCSDNSSIEEAIAEEEVDENSDTSNSSKNCDDISDFPNLGPSATKSKSCDDVTNPNNKGTLDCRTDKSVGGYENVGDEWGSYKITGGPVRYDATRTRVERFFKNIKQGNNKKTILSGYLKIIDLSDGNTCIIQSHANGTILKGEEAGSANRSAQFLIYAKKGTGNQVQLETHTTINPYTSDTSGAREIKNYTTLNYNQAYAFVYETGYNENGYAFSKIKIGNSEVFIEHNHTTENVVTRYGAYGTSDSGDLTAHIEFKNIAFCRE